MVVKTLKNLKKSQKNHKNDLQRLRIVLYYNSVAPEKESDEVDKSSALGRAIKSRVWKKSKKFQNSICKFKKAMLYYATDFFGGAFESALWLIENWIVRCNRKHRDVLNNYIEITSSLLQKSQ